MRIRQIGSLSLGGLLTPSTPSSGTTSVEPPPPLQNPTESVFPVSGVQNTDVARVQIIGGDTLSFNGPSVVGVDSVGVEYQSLDAVLMSLILREAETFDADDWSRLAIYGTRVGGTYEWKLNILDSSGSPDSVFRIGKGTLTGGTHVRAQATLQAHLLTSYPWCLGAAGPVSSSADTDGTASCKSTLALDGNTQKLWSEERTPASSAATGFQGEICHDADYIYIYTSAGWKRAALAAF